MRTITIEFVKGDIVKLFRGKAFKAAESVANDENFKAVYNAKHGGNDDIVDTRISDSLYARNLGETIALLADFITSRNTVVYSNADSQPTETVERVVLSVPGTSTATRETVHGAAVERITEGMMAGWTRNVMPNIAKNYEASCVDAEYSLKRIIYNKKAPTP